MSLSANRVNPLSSYLPTRSHAWGLVAVVMGSLLCLWLTDAITQWTNGRLVGLSSLTLAILLGMIIGNTLYPKFTFSLEDGVCFSKGQILRLAIVLYGFKITLTQVASVGGSAIAIDAAILSSTFILTYLFGTKWLKMDKTTTLLIGSGSSICGAAAVIATQPVVKAEAHKVTIAVATVVVFGTIAMLLYPFLHSIGWLSALVGTQQYGVYIGSTIHEVAQVVVAGNAINAEAGNTAVVTKMIRVMMLAPFLLILSFLLTQNSAQPAHALPESANQNPLLSRLKQVHIPWFAFVFILVVFINSWLPINEAIRTTMIHIDNLLLTMAMFALGLTTHFSAIKQAGIKPLVLGAVMFLWLIFGGAAINIGISFL